MTDFFQGVVAEFLRADRGVFVNPEILLQLELGASPKKGRFWYCDLMAVSLREREVYLCEVTYSSSVSALIKRLKAWKAHWPELELALQRDSGIDPTWHISVWVFLPESRQYIYERKLATLGAFVDPGMPKPRLTVLEDVLPWKYCTWDRQPEVF
ncbi:hypothetical protein [Methylobacillus flagellatus]|uniref:hypothetical protein n=1 Tax=Methylobacillus flagellatus TaxID=405 RepID=UPI0018A16EBB|nr:hypothetical protein [Methylobacillus flagellatus]